MPDTMTFTKVVGAFCGALLVFLLANWVGEALFTVKEVEPQAYAVDTGAAKSEGDTKAADQGPDFATVYASADPAAGEKVFAKCKACHKVDGNNSTGPHLNGVVGRAVASVEGFGYSDALKGHGGDWTPENLDHWLESPKDYAPGTKMAFAGLKKVQDRADVIAYLASLK